MSAHDPPVVEKSNFVNATVHEASKVKATCNATETSSDRASLDNATTKKKCFKPRALRTLNLLAFCVIVLAIGVLLQITAAAYRGKPSLQGLISNPVNVQARQAMISDVPVPTQELGGLIGTDTLVLPDPTFTQGIDEPAHTTDATIPDLPIPTQGTGEPTQTSEDFVMPFSTDAPPTAPNPNSYTSSQGLSSGHYFIGAYLPTLVAILLGIWWKCIFSRIKEMEPFYQMSGPNGARSSDSLHLKYHGATLPGVILSSLWSRHLLAFLGALNMGLITLCTLLSSETMWLESEGSTCGIQAGLEGESNPDCTMTLCMRQGHSLAVGAILFAVVLFTGWVIVYTRRKATGLQHDPTSIAAHAGLINDELMREMSKTQQDHTRRYTLARSHANGPVTIVSTSRASHLSSAFHQHRRHIRSASKYGHFSMHPALLITFWLAQVGILVMLFYYRFVSEPNTGNRFEDFMNSQDIGVRTFMTALGLGVKFYWGWIEGYMRSMRPYLALASPKGAPAAQSVLLRSPSHSVTALLQADTWRYPLLAIVTIMSLLSEVLVIMLNGVPFTTSLLRVAFNISVFASIGILFAMIASLTAVIVWVFVKKTKRSLPEVPECIAHVADLLGDVEGRRAMAQLVNGKAGAEARHDQQMRFALQETVSSEQGASEWRIVKVAAHSVV